MQRKLIKHGPSSHIIVLPAKWVANNSLSAGDYLSLEEHPDHIIISLEGHTHKSVATVQVDGLDRTSIMLTIRAAYRQGYHTIHVQHNNIHAEHLRVQEQVSIPSVIHTEVNRLIGVEIVDQQAHKTTIQELSKPSSEELRGVHRKLFTMTHQLILHLADQDSEQIDIEQRHDVITRTASFVIRTARGGAQLTSLEREQFLHAASSIDIIVDIIKYHKRTLQPTPISYAKTLAQAMAEVENVVFGHKLSAMRAFQECKADLRKQPVERLDTVIDILSDIIVTHATPKNMNKVNTYI